ncbi:MAG TPA: hypothetical protein VGQ76_06325 [Thermoanaerobaculia bacterium]|jgi:ABC-type transport system involved in multi-copper enzyme maturation permease subunit|nr:hypothetical protein [Thermoanaerobaculia bacterium]
MNAALLIASRELRDRSRLFLIAAALSVSPFLAALTIREHRQLGIASVAGFLAIAYSCSLALALGVSSIGRELTERRMSFFFAKPVSATAIWLGKAAAGLLTALGALAIIVLPTFLFAREGWKNMFMSGGGAVALNTALICLVLFFGGNVVSTMLRSRSARVVVDFFLLAIAAIAAFAIVRPILMRGGKDIAGDIIVGLCVAVLLVLAAAPAWQLTRGRIDARQNHAALSKFLWIGVAVALIGTAAFTYWVIATPPAKITQTFQFDQDPSGRWIYVSGTAPGRGEYMASHLIDTATGKHERVSGLPWGDAHLSGDGRMLVWLESAEILPRVGTSRFYMRRLEPGAKQIATPLVTRLPAHLVLSHDGSRVALATGGRVEVYELVSGRLLAAVQGIDTSVAYLLYFAGPDVVRIIEADKKDREIRHFRELDLVERKLMTTGEWTTGENRGFNRTADGSRLYSRADSTIIDARTGAALLTLPVKPTRWFYATMLDDGSSIVTRDAKLFAIDANGKVTAEVPLPVDAALVVARMGSSKVVLSAGSIVQHTQRMLIVDLATRKVETSVTGIYGPMLTGGVVPHYEEITAFAGIDASQKPMLWDSRTGTKRPLPS